jgi:uncharacterized protein
MPEFAPWQWLVGLFCAFMVGFAKTGVPGIGIMVIPLMVLTVGDARLSAGWLLPILCIADVLAVYYWRRHANVRRLFSLTPWVVAGMVGGGFALSLHERTLRPIVGAIIFAMLAVYLYRRLRLDQAIVSSHPAPYGAAAGFATTVANAAGPVMSIYLLSMRLPKEEFVGTGAWFFFVVNLTKVPIYMWHGLFSRQSLIFDGLMIPAVLAGALTGRWIISHISPRVFEIVVVGLTFVSTLLLFR